MGGWESSKGIQRSTTVVGILSALGERCGVPCRVYSRESEFVDSSDHDIIQSWNPGEVLGIEEVSYTSNCCKGIS